VTGHEKQIVEKGFDQDRLDYWAMRDKLLAKYAGKWVAVHKGRVVAVGDEPLAIMDQALAGDGYAYTNKVGEEDKIVIRQRRVSFPYDDTYSPTPLPRMAVVLHNFPQTKGKPLRMPSLTREPMLLACQWTIAKTSTFFSFLFTRRLPSFYWREALGDVLRSKSRGRWPSL
jgi:Family of unknown function (DUF5678)